MGRAYVRRVLSALAVGSALWLGACAEVPEEAVTLSVTVGKDLEAVHRSHRALAQRYFARMKRDVNEFIDEVYTPRLVKGVATKFGLVQKFEAEMRAETGKPLQKILLPFVNQAMAQVARRRAAVLNPLEAQEREVVRAIDDAYARVQNAHAIVTGHLASVRKVQQAQEELLAGAGLEGLRKDFIDTTADLSDQINDVLGKARRNKEALESALEGTLDNVESLIKAAKERP